MTRDINEMIAELPEEDDQVREILKALLERLELLEDRLKTPIKQGKK